MVDLTTTFKVDIGDLENEKENLANFLRAHFRINSSVTRKGLELKMEDDSPRTLTRMVNKFVYRRKLNCTHCVTARKNVVKISRFNKPKKNRLAVLGKIFGFRQSQKKMQKPLPFGKRFLRLEKHR